MSSSALWAMTTAFERVGPGLALVVLVKRQRMNLSSLANHFARHVEIPKEPQRPRVQQAGVSVRGRTMSPVNDLNFHSAPGQSQCGHHPDWACAHDKDICLVGFHKPS
jgi:hypothetical protein